jgi:Protein of unknown function (DUF2924)
MSFQGPTQEALAVELSKLPGHSVHELRERWRALFRGEPPAAFGPDLLRRSIAQKLQEDAYGKLPSSAQRDLNRMVASLEKNPANRIDLPRRIMAGAVLVRDWKGTAHRVTVAENGFSYQQRSYASLSEIAREITGTRWNGPRFFGLRSSEKSAGNKPDNTAERKRGRPPKQTTTQESSATYETGHGI